jgi:exopolyphosphatase/guanosine-5'-triphosphate,3'-diphosphate pyrophosphatase
VNELGVRDGLLLAMIAERTASVSAPAAALDRMARVRAFAQACRSNAHHCEHVALLAGQVFDQLQARHEVPVESRDLLVAAALLHDVGYLVNHARHHKHAYHLIMHANLDGFTPREVELIANVARYHRRALPKKRHGNFARLERPDRRLVRQLGGILRIACGLDRTHTGRVTAVRCENGRGAMRLVIEAASDPQVEIWDAERKVGLFQKAFDVDVRFVWHRSAQARPKLVPAARSRRLAAGD